MSFNEQKLDTEHVLQEDQFGVQNTFIFGIKKVKNHLKTNTPHPLAEIEENRDILDQKRTFENLSILQGKHAPFKLQHEIEFSKKIGRLPCLRSSNLMQDVLRGFDDSIDVKDVLNNQREFCEFNIDPHNELYKIKP